MSTKKHVLLSNTTISIFIIYFLVTFIIFKFNQIEINQKLYITIMQNINYILLEVICYVRNMFKQSILLINMFYLLTLGVNYDPK